MAIGTAGCYFMVGAAQSLTAVVRARVTIYAGMDPGSQPGRGCQLKRSPRPAALQFDPRLTAEATVASAQTEVQPSAFARALVASANPDPAPEDEAVIAQAKAEAAADGMGQYADKALAAMAAHSVPDMAVPSTKEWKALYKRYQHPAGQLGL